MPVAFFVQQLLPTCSARLCLQHICLFCAAIVSHLQCSPMSAAQLPLLCSNCFPPAVLACVCSTFAFFVQQCFPFAVLAYVCSTVAFVVQQLFPTCSARLCLQHICLFCAVTASHLQCSLVSAAQLPFVCSKCFPFAVLAGVSSTIAFHLSQLPIICSKLPFICISCLSFAPSCLSLAGPKWGPWCVWPCQWANLIGALISVFIQSGESFQVSLLKFRILPLVI